ncbi:unnamed protein product [Darwinula stevensoni]|uniref:Uncharacterized protein n=1 Tax=Darwinula stevensoni TaxID=69355 RepID=A0A7R9A861_9CRUS|nr:unnamed protein product [Darwinula stevensoni]CAG0895734.1 unnamed protein product [Darwinula stevensoni]
MPLCSYDVKMSVVRGLGPSCKEHFHTLLRCGSGGRDHAECCHRTGVHPNCAPLCQGIITPQVRDNPSFCLGFIGNIIQCFQEGTGLLPSPPLEFHLLGVTNNSVTLMWDRPVEGNVSGYQVRFQKVSAAFGGAPDLTMSQKMNVSEEKVVLGNLTNAEEYDFVVVAWNEHGFSLPSSSITVNVSETSYQGVAVAGVPPPPHSLTVADKSSTYLLISWLPPEISLISELLEYKLFHRTLNGTEFAETRTQKTWTKLDGLEPNTQYVIYARTLGEKGSSHPSETLIAWTDPFYPAFVEPPTIHPTSLVLEGSNITVVCIAMGEPTPAVSMYVAGRLVKNETTRHLVAVVANVSRNMGQISCLADNGFGSPAQAARNILISRKPLLEAADMTLASEGDSVTLECQVDAYPKPRLVWWRNDKPVIHGGKYDIQVRDSFENPGYYLMRLGISSVNASDNGEYRCFAENAFGNMSQVIQVSVRPRVLLVERMKCIGNGDQRMMGLNEGCAIYVYEQEKVMNVSECCRKEGVSPECLDACWMNVDFESLADNPHCIPEYYKIMKCAADGSDHRGCCSQWGVPKRCLDWCRGEAVPNAPLCLISFLQQMLSCFHEGKDMLPGMPGNVHVEPVDDVTVNVIWDPPDKNAKMIDAYRVFWRPVGSASAEKTDTKETHLQIGGLEAGVSYEAAVKAGNNYGTSQLTQPVLFSTHAKSYSEPVSHRGGTVETVVGILVALVAIGAIAVGLLFYARKYRLFGHKATAEGVSFENPSYLREQTDPNTTVHQLGSGPESPGNGHVNGVNHNGHQGWHQEALHTSTPFHLDVLGGERLDVSHAYDAVGFQKLKNAPS